MRKRELFVIGGMELYYSTEPKTLEYLKLYIHIFREINQKMINEQELQNS